MTDSHTAGGVGAGIPFAYMVAGPRRYGAFPVRVMERKGWEMQAVVRGAARPFGPGRQPDDVYLDQPRLYCFPPGHAHGWTAPDQDLSEVVVVHVLPEPLNEQGVDVPEDALCISLSELDLLRLRTLFDWIFPHFVQPHTGSHALMRGCVPLLFDLFRPAVASPVTTGREPAMWVDAAMRWYRQSLLSQPRVEDVARGVGLSASQLRRVFSAAGKPSPDKVFRAIRMDYARRLLVGLPVPVAHIAEELGFNSASAFTRAFKHYYNETPRNVRAALQ